MSADLVDKTRHTFLGIADSIDGSIIKNGIRNLSISKVGCYVGVTAKLFCHRNCSPKLSKNIKKLLPIMPSITAHMSYLFWSPKEKRLVHPTRDVNWRRFQEDFEEILEA